MDEAMARWSRMVDFCNRVGWHSRRSYKCEREYMSAALGVGCSVIAGRFGAGVANVAIGVYVNCVEFGVFVAKRDESG